LKTDFLLAEINNFETSLTVIKAGEADEEG
jgi:hypothetical protein